MTGVYGKSGNSCIGTERDCSDWSVVFRAYYGVSGEAGVFRIKKLSGRFRSSEKQDVYLKSHII